MSALFQAAAVLVTMLGLVCGLLVLARLRNVRQALGVLLEFLLAAGLLRLADDPTIRSLVVVAVVIGIRKVVVPSLKQDGRDRDPVAMG